MIRQTLNPQMPHGQEIADCDCSQLAVSHFDLKEKLFRSAYTDCYTRAERMDMHAQLKALSDRYRELTGQHLS